MLRCNDESLYTGWTNDFESRMNAHTEGTASKYTRSRRPVRCVLRIHCESASQARRVEALLKRLSRARKLRLLANASLLSETLYAMTGSCLSFELLADPE